PEGRQTTTVLDAKGHVVQQQIPGILPILPDYYGDGQLYHVVQGSRSSKRSYYPSSGYLSDSTNALLQNTHFLRDLVGRATQQQQPNGDVIDASYDGNGQMLTLTPPGRPAHKFEFTPVGLPHKYTPPDVGSGLKSVIRDYDFDGLLTG